MLFGSVGVALYRPAILSHISDITPPSEQGKVMGLYGTLEDIGVIIGPMLGGYVWDNIGPDETFFLSMGVLIFASMICTRGIIEEKNNSF